MTGLDQALIEVEPCKLKPDAVDLTSGEDRLHLTAAQWAEFATRVKRGDFDHLGIGPAS